MIHFVQKMTKAYCYFELCTAGGTHDTNAYVYMSHYGTVGIPMLVTSGGMVPLGMIPLSIL